MTAYEKYSTLVGVEQGGDKVFVKSGGSIDIETGGDILVNGVSLIDEVAALSGLDSGELGVLNGVTAGTAAASKAVVLDASKGISTITSATITTLTAPNIAGNVTFADGTTDVDIASHDTTNGLKLGGVLVTATAAEINILDGVTATAAELNANDITAQTETIDSGVAVSVVKTITNIDNTVTGAGAITLAAPDASMLGRVKIIEMTVDGGDVTLALTNVQGGTAATTATFAAVNDTLLLIGGTNKWHVIGESGVVLT